MDHFWCSMIIEYWYWHKWRFVSGGIIVSNNSYWIEHHIAMICHPQFICNHHSPDTCLLLQISFYLFFRRGVIKIQFVIFLVPKSKTPNIEMKKKMVENQELHFLIFFLYCLLKENFQRMYIEQAVVSQWSKAKIIRKIIVWSNRGGEGSCPIYLWRKFYKIGNYILIFFLYFESLKIK